MSNPATPPELIPLNVNEPVPDFVANRRRDALLAQMEAERRVRGDVREVPGFAPCCRCGGPAGRSAPIVDGWRQHKACASRWGRVQSAALARGKGQTAISEESAACVVRAGFEPTEYRRRGWNDDEPQTAWSHLDRREVRELRALVSDLPRLRREAGLDPARCAGGPCAWCGVREATGWADRDLKWANGESAPLCGQCAEVADRRGIQWVSDFSAQRALIAEALTEVPAMLGDPGPEGLRCYAETVSVPGEGHEGRWGHLSADAVEAFRLDQWGLYNGRHAPADRKSEALAHRAAREAENRALRAEERAGAQHYHWEVAP